MGPHRLAPLLALAAIAFAGCAPRSNLYHWRGYDEGLYRHYKQPQDREPWVETLKLVIIESEERGSKIPPGILAEYGYALYEEGRFPEAIAHFERERAEWPESRELMDKMIRNARTRGAQAPSAPAARGPAGALEKTR